jgi:hypothetical protein
MGGKPSKGTKKDRRLKENRRRRESWITRRRRLWRKGK